MKTKWKRILNRSVLGWVFGAQLFCQVAQAHEVKWGATAGGDSPTLMNQYDAFKYCIDLNPEEGVRTAVATALGYRWNSANNRWDVTTPRSPAHLDKMPTEAVYLPTPNQLEERYRLASHEFRSRYYWSSSVHHVHSYIAHVLVGDYYIDSFYRSVGIGAVRCVRSR